MLQTGITHTQETCIRLALVKDKKFGVTRRLIRVFLAAIPVVGGFFVGLDSIWGILLVVLGVYVYYSTSAMYQRDAEKAFRGTPEKYRKVDYYFRDKDMLVEAGGLKKEVPYDSIKAMFTDGTYYYLFINSEQAFMMELKNPSRKEWEAFEAFLKEKTGKKLKTVVARESYINMLRRRNRE